jgi:hypothetical protein
MCEEHFCDVSILQTVHISIWFYFSHEDGGDTFFLISGNRLQERVHSVTI